MALVYAQFDYRSWLGTWRPFQFLRNYESSIYIQFYDQQRLLTSAVHSPNMYIGAMDFLNLVEAHFQIINICLLM